MDDTIPDEALIEMGREPNAASKQSKIAPQINPAATLSHLLNTLLLPQRLTTLALPTPLSFPSTGPIPSPHPPTTSVMSTLHLRALEALNNLLLTTAASLPSDAAVASQAVGTIPVQGVWDGMFTIIGAAGAEAEALNAKGQEMRLEIIEMALGCTWGLGKVAASQLVSRQAEPVELHAEYISP
jgi:hypothetical protein